jgi:hypothetical protein
MHHTRIAVLACIGAAGLISWNAYANAATGQDSEIARITNAPAGSGSVATVNLPLNMEPLMLPGEDRVHGEAPAVLFAAALPIDNR